MRDKVPWWIRMGAKLVLARLPLSYEFWRTLGIFRHGDMHNPNHAIGVFQAHLQRASARHAMPGNYVCMELGPGDSASFFALNAVRVAKRFERRLSAQVKRRHSS